MGDVITRFKLETTQYDSKLRDAAKGLKELTEHLTLAGKDFDKFAKDSVASARALGNVEVGAKNAKDKVRELVAAYNEASRAYNNMTKEQQSGEYGQAYAKSLQTLQQRIKAAKDELYSAKSETMDFSNVLQSLGSQLGVNGRLLGVLTTGTLGYTAAITAGAAAVAYAAKEWANYNMELTRQQQITSVTTGLSGGDAEQMTVAVRALARTYDIDFRQGINAANTLMSQFGVTGDEAIQLLRDGMQGMIQGDGPKLLQMIQQYAPAFRDAGVSASQLIAVIQNSEGGIFTDQNMNAIVMGIKNIRLMTKATSDALAQLGIDGQKMSQDLSDGTITIFDALKQVAGAIENTNSSSQEAGQVMQQVFGRQGAMAGTKLGEAIATLNLNLEETKQQTGELGERLDGLVDINTRLEQSINDAFGTDVVSEFSTKVETDLKTALIGVVKLTDVVITGWKDWGLMFDMLAEKYPVLYNIADAMATAGQVAFATIQPVTMLYEALKNIADLDTGQSSGEGGDGKVVIPGIHTGNEMITKPFKPTLPTTPRGKGGSRTTAATVYEAGSIAAQEQEVQKLRKLWREAGDEGIRNGYLAQLIEAENVLKRMNEEATLQREQAQGKLLETKPVGDIGMLDVTGLGVGGVDVLADLKKGAIDLRTPLKALEEELQRLIEKQQQFGGISAETWQSYQTKIDAVKQKIGEFKGDTKKGAEDSKQSWRQAAQAVTTVGGALQQIDDPAAKILGIVGQAIAQVALGFAQANANTGKEGNIWNWIAATAAGLVTMVTTISQIHAATGYAQGGIVKGNSYSGDNVLGQVGDGGELVGLNAGEVVLTRAMQGNLASQLQGGGLGNMQLSALVKGEQLILAINNTGKRTGMGEMVFWR